MALPCQIIQYTSLSAVPGSQFSQDNTCSYFENIILSFQIICPPSSYWYCFVLVWPKLFKLYNKFSIVGSINSISVSVTEKSFFYSLGMHTVMDIGAPVSEKPPPLPPKQPLHTAHGQTLYDHTQHFRQRAQSHDTRPPTTIVRRPSPATGSRMRGRLNSDGSTPSSLRSSNKAPSTSSIEKAELRESPPPPYSEYDRHHLPPIPPRHYSHTSHQQHQSDHSYAGHSMQRTRSHGQVQFRRQGIAPIERSRSDRRASPEVFQLRSPTTVTGGTLV